MATNIPQWQTLALDAEADLCPCDETTLLRDAARTFGLSRGATRLLRQLILLGHLSVNNTRRTLRLRLPELIDSGVVDPELLGMDRMGYGFIVANDVWRRLRAARAVEEVAS